MATQSAYAGDVEPAQAWAALAGSSLAVLVDVRTVAEWNFVGIPDLSALDRSVVLVEWQRYPAMDVNDRFLGELEESLAGLGLGREAEVYFLCRSGGRSQSAAIAATAGGYAAAFNVAGGFEGALGPDRHRGCVGGWKASGLPWIQS